MGRLLVAVALAVSMPALAADARAVGAAPPTTAADRASRPVVAIYEFRSGVSETGARAATDMFVTALVKSGRFRVVERSRLNEGVVREKQLNANGLATGDVGSTQLQGASAHDKEVGALSALRAGGTTIRAPEPLADAARSASSTSAAIRTIEIVEPGAGSSVRQGQVRVRIRDSALGAGTANSMATVELSALAPAPPPVGNRRRAPQRS